jgi:hypothetical protein
MKIVDANAENDINNKQPNNTRVLTLANILGNSRDRSLVAALMLMGTNMAIGGIKERLSGSRSDLLEQSN